MICNMVFGTIDFLPLCQFRAAFGNINTKVDPVDRLTLLQKTSGNALMLGLRITFLCGRNALIIVYKRIRF
jgi:hypothetical protein